MQIAFTHCYHRQRGVSDYKLQECVRRDDGEWDHMLFVGRANEAIVYMSPSATHIETSNEQLRKTLGEIVVAGLMQL